MRERVLSVTLDDCIVQDFTSGGKGGQNQDKRHTGIRIIHRDSGARGECREERSQLQNKKIAFRRMTEDIRFRLWMNKVLAEQKGCPTPEQRVAHDIRDEYLMVEVRGPDGWQVAEPSEFVLGS